MSYIVQKDFCEVSFQELIDAVPGNDYCNGSLAQPPVLTAANLKETLHLDDVLAAIAKAPELQPPAAAPVPDPKPTV